MSTELAIEPEPAVQVGHCTLSQKENEHLLSVSSYHRETERVREMILILTSLHKA
uniref:Uncharacterized protein n=1 Tax=Anguilla anguilla TaxID=7936 RepID=A0A0E9RFB5_ANGAN